MTALKPIESRVSVRAVTDPLEERALLRKLLLNKQCAKPTCTADTCDPHHIWPRSTINNSAWFVQWIAEDEGGEKKITPHVTGLCREHHDDVEQHRAWIKLEEGVFNWYDRGKEDETKMVGDIEVHIPYSVMGEWIKVGKLDPQPLDPNQKRKVGPRGTKGKPQSRAVVSINVPKTEQENGAEAMRTMIDACKDKWKEERGWSDNVPDYYPIMAALAEALQ